MNRTTTKLAFLLPLLLAAPLHGQQEEENPFRTFPPELPPDASTAASFVTLMEHVLVPAETLDPWLEVHPLQGDASALRQAVSGWIAEGKATLDHTSLSAASATRPCTNATTLELMYPTDFEPPAPGEWPFPSAFQTRNLGYESTAGVGVSDGALALRVEIEQAEMADHRSWHPLAERTRQPGDVFLPHFRTVTVQQRPAPAADGKDTDPFADPSPPELVPKPSGLLLPPGRVFLVSRTDSDVADPAARPVRLIFLRGAIREETAAPAANRLTENPQLSIRLSRVDHRTASAWLQQHGPLAVPENAWSAVEGWQREGKAATLGNLGGSLRGNDKHIFGNVLEVIYPTEWEKASPVPAADGTSAVPQFSNAQSFEMRNTGLSAEAQLHSDSRGLLLDLSLQRVLLTGSSVHHRIHLDKEWVENIATPRFSSNHWQGEIRLTPGKWTLLGIGGDILPDGRFDSGNCVFAFVKVE